MSGNALRGNLKVLSAKGMHIWAESGTGNGARCHKDQQIFTGIEGQHYLQRCRKLQEVVDLTKSASIRPSKIYRLLLTLANCWFTSCTSLLWSLQYFVAGKGWHNWAIVPGSSLAPASIQQ